MDPIMVPRPDPEFSSLDGLTTIAIDTDPLSNLYLTLRSAEVNKVQVLSITPFKFFGVRDGFIVITYDKSKDPRNKG